MLAAWCPCSHGLSARGHRSVLHYCWRDLLAKHQVLLLNCSDGVDGPDGDPEGADVCFAPASGAKADITDWPVRAQQQTHAVQQTACRSRPAKLLDQLVGRARNASEGIGRQAGLTLRP